jgi:hypothetical protein
VALPMITSPEDGAMPLTKKRFVSPAFAFAAYYFLAV